MSMERWIKGQQALGNNVAAEIGRMLVEKYGDISLTSVATPVKEAVKTFSRDQLILPKEPSPKALGLLKRAEEAGLGGLFAIHSLSAVRLTKDTQVSGWNKKPEDWYWEQIAFGSLREDAGQLPGVEILIDKTPRPNYENGRQLHENDPLGPFMARLREEKRISIRRNMPETSRFWTSPEPELTQVVLLEIAQLLEVDTSEVRLPTETEFNILGNFIYPHFGDANTLEWFDDKFEDFDRLIGGHSGFGGLMNVRRRWSDRHRDDIAFRLLVVVSPRA